MGYVYALTSAKTGLRYIGVVLKENKTPNDRFDEHMHQASQGSMTLLHVAMRDDPGSFRLDILAELDDVDALSALECFYIEKFNTNASRGGRGYNMTDGGQGTTGFRWTKSSCDKIRHMCTVSAEELKTDCLTLTLDEMSAKYCVGKASIRRWMKDLGMTKKRIQRTVNNQSKGSWAEVDEKMLMELYERGLSYEEMAAQLDRTVGAIMTKLVRLRKRFRTTSRRFRNQHLKKDEFIVRPGRYSK